jgi:hypothetical protein
MPANTYKTNADPKQANAQVVIDQWGGLAPTPDPHAMDPNLAAVQVNAYSPNPGELRCRSGVKLVRFTT